MPDVWHGVGAGVRDQLARGLPDGPVARIQAPQPSEIERLMDELEKALYALGEEADRLDDALSPVLAEPATASGEVAPPSNETRLGRRLQSFVELARRSDHKLRSISSRCRL